MIEKSRAPRCPAKNNAATWGSRFRARLRCICPEALPWLIVNAAATSAAAQSQKSHAQSARWSAPVRRPVSSAIADNRRALAAASTRAQSSIAATSAPSSDRHSSVGAGSDISNMCAILVAATDSTTVRVTGRLRSPAGCAAANDGSNSAPAITFDHSR
ncbi:Uncharacterised protein [Mycobacterium tuberculosis]|nr:Uncharacterised protein [Mycobacterium tuberculosis]